MTINMLSTGAVVGLSFGLWLCYGLWVVVYRLWFHPLARFPGPKLAASTKWYEFYFDIVKHPGGQFFKELSRMHDQYGPIVRLNPDEIHVRDPAWFDTLYAPNPTKRNKYPPSAEMAGLTLGTHGTVDHDLHRRRRMANSPLFSKRAVGSAQSLIHEHVEELAANFEKMVNSDQTLDLQMTFLAYTTDVIYHYMFDKRTNYQHDPKAALGWKHSMEAVAQATPWSKQFPWMNAKLLMLPFPILEMFLSRILPDIVGLLGTHKLMAKVVDDYVKARDAGENKDEDDRVKPKTLFHAIDKSGLPDQEKSPHRLTQEGLTVLFAGGETGSRLLAHTVYHLLANPDVLKKVKEEILEAAGDSDRVPDVKVLETLPWFVSLSIERLKLHYKRLMILKNASIRESLRLRAATTSRLPLVSQKDLVYENWIIPSGTAVSMSHPDILHNDDVFPRARTFKPDRWFTATDIQNRLFVPFGKGTRMCIGMEFAYGEMYMSLASILCRFELQLYDTTWERDVDYTRDCFLGESDISSRGIRVKVLSDNGRFKAKQ